MSIPEQLIRQHAYQIWEREGKPEGCADIHWKKAQQEIILMYAETADKRKMHQLWLDSYEKKIFTAKIIKSASANRL